MGGVKNRFGAPAPPVPLRAAFRRKITKLEGTKCVMKFPLRTLPETRGGLFMSSFHPPLTSSSTSAFVGDKERRKEGWRTGRRDQDGPRQREGQPRVRVQRPTRQERCLLYTHASAHTHADARLPSYILGSEVFSINPISVTKDLRQAFFAVLACKQPNVHIRKQQWSTLACEARW